MPPISVSIWAALVSAMAVDCGFDTTCKRLIFIEMDGILERRCNGTIISDGRNGTYS